MKKKNRIWIYQLLILVMFLTSSNSCKKDDAIIKKDPIITWANPAAITLGTLLSKIQLNATADVAGKFVYTPAIGTKLNEGANQDLKVDFTPTDAAVYNSASKTVKINVLASSGTVSDIDGNVYNTVTIGTQTWMAENLNIGKRIENNGWYQLQTDNGIIEKYCYGNSDSIGEIYGGLYEWQEMMQYNSSDEGVIGTTQGICPTGWHLPTDQEWTTLEDYLGGSMAGGKMKAEGTAFWFSPNEDATNESGFNALPGGLRLIANSNYYGLGEVGVFWSATEEVQDSVMGKQRQLQSNTGFLFHGLSTKDYGMSVRCVKD